MNLNYKQALNILGQQKCCGKLMKVNEFYSQGTETITAVCKKCGNYTSIEMGQLDEEEYDKDQEAVL